MPEPNNRTPLDPSISTRCSVLDRTSVIAELLDLSIAIHPVLETDSELSGLIEQVENLLGAIYQRAGALLEEKLNEALEEKLNEADES